MHEEANGRVPIDSSDFFLRQKKSLAMMERRPVRRRAADLVGPGIDSHTLRVPSLSDAVASFNGYYSVAAGSPDSPDPVGAFVGHVVSDAELGGVQVVTSLASGTRYQRVFTRNPYDPEWLTWGAWVLV